VSALLTIEKPILTCEVCGKGNGEDGPWILCTDCSELLKTLLQFKKYDVDLENLMFLKEILRSEARQIGLTT
jgi:hypothetical protein